MAAAAISSSRIAFQARPMREFSNRRVTRMMRQTKQQHEKVKIERIKLGVGDLQAEKFQHRLKEQRRLDDGSDASRAVGEIDRLVEIVDQGAHHLGKTQGDDGEIIAAQTQHRQSEHDAGERADADAQHEKNKKPVRRQRKPAAGDERVGLRRAEDRPEIGADGVESDEAEIEQSRRSRRRC